MFDNPMNFLLSLSLPALVIGVFVLLAIASEIGFWIGFGVVKTVSKLNNRKITTQIDNNVSTITNSSLALLALFLGFAFSSAMNHFEKNRDAVVSEAAAIEIAYNHTGLLQEPFCAKIKNEITTYTNIRLKLSSGNVNDAQIREIRDESIKQYALIWQDTKEMLKLNPDGQLNNTFIGALSNMLQAQSMRTTSLLNEIPQGLFIPIGLFLLFNGVLVGVSLGEGARRHLLLSCGLYLLVALAVGIIVDLDRPLQGFINVNQEAMLLLKESIK
jgi:hypothetical protein